jgi:peptide subunit release factor 1 (eRF1)
MITRDDIRELAQFRNDDGCALSFYFQPTTPPDRSHREEAILAKDLVKRALQEAQKNGRNGSARADLDRILEIAEHLHGNQARAKAIFACKSQNLWREFDLPARLSTTSLFVNQRFHLRPLAAILEALPTVCVALVDRKTARLFDLRLDQIKEMAEWTDDLTRLGRRSDGFQGYNAGHAERHFANDAMHHFKNVAERLKDLYERGQWEKLVIGCRDDVCPEFEAQIPQYLKSRLIGRIPLDLNAPPEQVRDEATRLRRARREEKREALIREALGQAQRNGRGAMGLRRVLSAIETGEIQTLLLGENFSAHAVECPNCGHVDSHVTESCAVCGKPVREVEDVSDTIIGQAVAKRVDILYVPANPEFEKAGNIAALLRFRADQNTPAKVAS